LPLFSAHDANKNVIHIDTTDATPPLLVHDANVYRMGDLVL
jgi:hypothetical protein